VRSHLHAEHPASSQDWCETVGPCSMFIVCVLRRPVIVSVSRCVCEVADGLIKARWIAAFDSGSVIGLSRWINGL